MRYFSFIFAFMFACTVFIQAKDYNDLLNEQNRNNEIISRVGKSDVVVTMPDFVFENTNTKIGIQFINPESSKLKENNRVLNFILNGQEIPVQFDEKGYGTISHTFNSGENASILFEDFSYHSELNVISLWMVLVPVAVIFLLITLKVLNQRAKKKIAEKNLRSIEASKSANVSPKKEKPEEKSKKAEKEEEIVA